MRVIGIDDKGNVIIEKTSSAGKTEEIILMAETVSAIEEFGKTVARIFREIMQALAPVFQQLAEEYSRFLNTALNEGEQQLADTAELMAELMERVAEIQEENRIRRETRVYQRKQCGRIRGRTRQQAKSTLKYKRYELRVYSRKERQGFHE